MHLGRCKRYLPFKMWVSDRFILVISLPFRGVSGIILQLGFQNALELVHRAHSVGLTTYMSAG